LRRRTAPGWLLTACPPLSAASFSPSMGDPYRKASFFRRLTRFLGVACSVRRQICLPMRVRSNRPFAVFGASFASASDVSSQTCSPPLSLLHAAANPSRAKKRKRLSRYAIYALDLCVSKNASDAAVEPTKRAVCLDDEPAAVRFVVRSVTEFLQRHFLLSDPATLSPSMVESTGRAQSPEPGETSPLLSQQLADELSLLARDAEGRNSAFSAKEKVKLHAFGALPSTPATGSSNRVSSKRLKGGRPVSSPAVLRIASSAGRIPAHEPLPAPPALMSALTSPQEAAGTGRRKWGTRLTRPTAGLTREPFWQLRAASPLTASPSVVAGPRALSMLTSEELDVDCPSGASDDTAHDAHFTSTDKVGGVVEIAVTFAECDFVLLLHTITACLGFITVAVRCTRPGICAQH